MAAEATAIHLIFPELRGRVKGGAAVDERTTAKVAGRARRRMSAAGRADERIEQRFVNLLDEPALVPRLAPLVQQEITIRLLTGPHGPQLRRLVIAWSPGHQIARVVAWLKQHFAQPLQGDDLADRAHMSPSTFRQHFRALTGVSPLQYQKQLRLQEAR